MSMSMTGLPSDGNLRLGDIKLPPGKQITQEEAAEPVAWVTERAVRNPGTTWAALRAMHGQTGLVPVLLPADLVAPVVDFYFYEPAQSPASQIGQLDAAGVLAGLWDGKHADQRAELGRRTASDPEPRRSGGLFGKLRRAHHEGYRFGDIAAVAADSLTHHGGHAGPAPAPPPVTPPGRSTPPPFPGLAPAQHEALDPASLQAALAPLERARIGLVEASRAADVLAITGWGDFDGFGFGDEPIGVWLGSVLRSWEDRFGAYLLGAGDLHIRLLVERPPRTFEEATAIAAEQWATCISCGPDAGPEDEGGLTDIPGIAAALTGSAVWTLSWA